MPQFTAFRFPSICAVGRSGKSGELYDKQDGRALRFQRAAAEKQLNDAMAVLRVAISRHAQVVQEVNEAENELLAEQQKPQSLDAKQKKPDGRVEWEAIFRPRNRTSDWPLHLALARRSGAPLAVPAGTPGPLPTAEAHPESAGKEVFGLPETRCAGGRQGWVTKTRLGE